MKDAIVADLGGQEALSTLQLAQCENAALSTAVLRDMQVRWLKGEPVPVTEMATVENTFNRTAAALGTRRRAKDIAPSLAEVSDALLDALGAVNGTPILPGDPMGGAATAGAIEAGGEGPAKKSAHIELEADSPKSEPKSDEQGIITTPNGARVGRDDVTGNFAIVDSRGELHGFRRSREAAIEFAKGLP